MLPLLNKYDKLLIRASGCGNILGVKKAIDNNANINAVDEEGNTALINVAMLGRDEPINENEDYIEVIKLLLLNNADINKQNDDKYTAITYACMYNNPKMVKLLLENLSNQNNDIKTGIVFACYYGNLEIMTILMKSNIIDVNTAMYEVNEEGFPICHDDFLDWASNVPLLTIACLKAHIDIIEFLLNQPNIDVNIRDTFNKTPLMLASEKGYTAVVRLLLTHPNIDIYKPNERESYHIAPIWTFNPNFPTAPTALTYAWDKDNNKIIEELLYHKTI